MRMFPETNRTSHRRPRPVLDTVEALAWISGLALLVACSALYIDRVASVRRALQRFAVVQAAAQPHAETIDQSLWSPERIAAWRTTLNLPSAGPLAVLRIPRIGLEVPVLKGTDEITLNRAVGHIEETALPGTRGNSGIAGHRDGFFRGLKDLEIGDAVALDTSQGQQIYRVQRIWIVDPEEVSVLDPTPGRSLTLVTCYPFYFVGPAPQRYIVRAVHVDDTSDGNSCRGCDP